MYVGSDTEIISLSLRFSHLCKIILKYTCLVKNVWFHLPKCLLKTLPIFLITRWSSGTASDFRSRGPGFKTTCGRVSDFSVEGTGVQNHLLPFQNLGKFVHPALLVSFGRDTKSHWSLLPGVYARGSKRSHTGGKCVTCCGLRVVVSISNPPIPGT